MPPEQKDAPLPGTAFPFTPESAEIRKHSVIIAGHRTSVSIEDVFWKALLAIAAARGASANSLITEIDRERPGNLSSALRLYVLAEALKGALPPIEGISGYPE
jgi:predicted DNA-binding ribbon-helix-helix protein